jgi:SAM-dependent methyltransferase
MSPRLASVAAALLLMPSVAAAQFDHPRPVPTVPYVSTAGPIVEKMLEMARVTDKDVVYDLGCGDGRIVIAAATRYGARGVGIDYDPVRIREANVNAIQAKVTDKVKFIKGDIYRADVSEATVVTLYLLPEVNLALRPVLWRQLPVGARVVSHNYHMGDEWPPEQTESVGGGIVYAWTIQPRHKR